MLFSKSLITCLNLHKNIRHFSKLNLDSFTLTRDKLNCNSLKYPQTVERSPHKATYSDFVSAKFGYMAEKAKQQEKQIQQQKFDYFLVLDFEATCDEKVLLKPQEIIEFPVLKVSAKTGLVESSFHQYVRPEYNPVLTTFCTSLTGILQSMVDDQPTFSEVLSMFNDWLYKEGLLQNGVKFAFVTCGDWDLKIMLPHQFGYLDMEIDPHFLKWINIKRSFADVNQTFPKSMMIMLTHYHLKHVGRHHSGIDDCRNIANVLLKLLESGYVFTINSK